MDSPMRASNVLLVLVIAERPNTARLEGITEPLRGILSPPIKHLGPAIPGFSGQSDASCGVLWSRVGWVG